MRRLLRELPSFLCVARAQSAIAGHELVIPANWSQQKWFQHPKILNGLDELIHLDGSRTVRVAMDWGGFYRPGPCPSPRGSSRGCRASVAGRGMSASRPRPRTFLLMGRDLLSETEIARRADAIGSYRVIGFPKLGASPRRTLRGIMVRYTCSPKKWRASSATCTDRLRRLSNIVRRIPSIRRSALKAWRIRSIVSNSLLTPSSA